MLNAAVAAHRLLIGPRVEQADVLRILIEVVVALLRGQTGPYFGEEDCIEGGLRVVEVLTVAGEAAEEHTLVLLVPVVDGEDDKLLVDSPRIGQGRHKRAVNHIP